MSPSAGVLFQNREDRNVLRPAGSLFRADHVVKSGDAYRDGSDDNGGRSLHEIDVSTGTRLRKGKVEVAAVAGQVQHLHLRERIRVMSEREPAGHIGCPESCIEVDKRFRESLEVLLIPSWSHVDVERRAYGRTVSQRRRRRSPRTARHAH